MEFEGRLREKPDNPEDVSVQRDAEEFRLQITKDIIKKVDKIQDTSLSHKQIEELNDNINTLLVERDLWDARVCELGGTAQSSMSEIDGTGRKYQYFGRAKSLSKAQQNLKEEQETKEYEVKGNLKESSRVVNLYYYGYNEDENILDKLETDEYMQKE